MKPLSSPYDAEDFVHELSDHAENPPGKDPVLKAFYQALVKLYLQKRTFYTLVSQVKQERASLTNQHLVNLVYRAYQFIKFKEKSLAYRNFTSAAQWIEEIKAVLSNAGYYQTYKQLLLTKSTNTSIFQRYLGPFSVIHYLFGKNPVSVMDVGCGGNYGLRGARNELFASIKDDTTTQFVNNHGRQPINFNRAVAVDREEPDDSDVYEWRLACSFYPQELDKLGSITEFEQRIRLNKTVKFFKTDFLKIELTEKFDAIIFCVILYQHNTAIINAFLRKAEQLLKPNGFIIVQDFAEVDPKNPSQLDFKTSWFGKKFAHKTFVKSTLTNNEFWEVLKWDNGRCQEVVEGQDFQRFLKLQKRTLKQFRKLPFKFFSGNI